jgi:hypothetical protein
MVLRLMRVGKYPAKPFNAGCRRGGDNSLPHCKAWALDHAKVHAEFHKVLAGALR